MTCNNTTSIQVLLVRNKEEKGVYTTHLPLDYKEIDIVYSICLGLDAFKELVGHQMIDESLLRVSAVQNTANASNNMYLLEAKSPMLRARLHLTAADNPQYQFILEINSPEVKLFELSEFTKFLNTRKFSDVILCVSGTEIPAHKIILANASPVFDALLTDETERIEIDDVQPETMLDMLQFIYKGYISDGLASDIFVKYSNLLRVDDTYCVDRLKTLCEKQLSLHLTFENILDSLILADSHSASSLKQHAIEFIAKNVELVKELPFYENFNSLHPETLSKILDIVVVEPRNTM